MSRTRMRMIDAVLISHRPWRWIMTSDRSFALALLLTMVAIVGSSPARAAEPAGRWAALEVQHGPTEPRGSVLGAIGVHGHWVIEVHDPDGSTVTHREFDNALTPSGMDLLWRIFTRTRSTGAWNVILGGPQNPCGAAGCFIVERGPATSNPGLVATTLTVTDRPLKLSGNITVANDGSITSVATRNRACFGIPPSPCFANPPLSDGSDHEFTQTDIAAVSVLAGQQVLVTVTITFATAQ
jgi:hypothetical protein